MNSHTIYSHKTRYVPPKVPIRIEDEVEQCLEELERNPETDGSRAVGAVVLILTVVVTCSLAYWAVTQIN